MKQINSGFGGLMTKFKLVSIILANLILSGCAGQNQNTPIKTPASLSFVVNGEFQEVKEELIMAIEGKGAVISYIAHSSEMLNRTALTLEIKEKVYHKAEIVLFCKAEISHKMVQAEPHNLVLCPYPIAIYSLSSNPKVTYLSIRQPPAGIPSYNAVHKLLLEIIHETMEF